jgi:AAA domain
MTYQTAISQEELARVVAEEKAKAERKRVGKEGRGRPNGEAGQQKQFALVPFDKITIDKTPAYLVKGLIPRTGLTVAWGPPKCGKSFFVFDLSRHVACGREYRGRRVQKGAVIYCTLEGTEGFRTRVEAFRQAKMAEEAREAPFYLIAAPWPWWPIMAH